jgi:outer membrane lipoprotein LolB
MLRFYARPYFILLLLYGVSLCAGCQRPPNKISDISQTYNTSTVKALNQLSYFRVSGKVGFRQGETGGQAKFIWQQNGQDFTLQLMNPFGGEEARLSFNKAAYSLKLPNQPAQHSDSIESLFRESLGWSAPIAHLPYWIKGIPLPLMPSTITYNKEGARVLVQDHWTITYSSIETVDGFVLPQSMVLERTDLPDGQARLKMLLHWSL